jgi:hypothetical protein
MWKLAIIAESILLAAFIHRRIWRKWPALSGFLALETARDLLGWWAYTHDSPRLYWWTYYGGNVVVDIAITLLIREIALSLVGPLKCLRAVVARNVPAMTVCFIAAGCLSASLGHAHIYFYESVEFYCRRLDMGVSAGCCAGLIMLLGIAVSLRIPRSRVERAIASGLLIELCSAYVQGVAWMDGCVAQGTLVRVRFASYLVTLLCFASPAFPGFGQSTSAHCHNNSLEDRGPFHA